MNEVERQLRAELKAAAGTIERLTQELLEERRSPTRVRSTVTKCGACLAARRTEEE